MKKLSPTVEKYVLHWGEMGSRWGVNRTIAQIHALLYLSPEPLPAEDIVALLGVARSNVSTSLRELQSIGLVKVSHVMGDRRDLFEAVHDVWELFSIVLDGRKRREVDPTVSVLRECMLEAESDKEIDATTKERINNMLSFLEGMTDWYSQIATVPTPTLKKLMRMGAKITKVLAK